MPWEYLKGTLSTASRGNDLQVYVRDQGYVNANDLGEEGYELVAVVHDNPSDLTTNNVGIFKRFVENDK
jgi:hypothetical protein